MSLNLSPVLTATGSARRMLPSIHRERPTVQDLKPNSFPLTHSQVGAARVDDHHLHLVERTLVCGPA